MELHAALMLSVLLLSVACMGAGASPVPASFLSRLRRSAGATAGLPTDPTVAATGTAESASTTPYTSPRPSRLARQAFQSDVLAVHFAHLHSEAAEVLREHGELYSHYKRERFADDPDPLVHELVLTYLPNANNLPHEIIRSTLSDSELVLLHYNALILFRDTLHRVSQSETHDIEIRVDVVIEKLRLVIDRLETTMIQLGQEASIIRVPSSIPAFHANVTAAEQNTRTLLVLQEFHAYLPHVRQDYRVLSNRY
ncbi:uncharacterized protein LOC110976436 [Acanthaster planci]|uniref:Uncharacterized protein LOC110976436 n=1 Tax=Acanthaster planci TaxID=133434 RepID=A0A8B7XZD8_ACAPL|nr:uncharacterized protein LOC110976436 [Acanthaster planci]